MFGDELCLPIVKIGIGFGKLPMRDGAGTLDADKKSNQLNATDEEEVAMAYLW